MEPIALADEIRLGAAPPPEPGRRSRASDPKRWSIRRACRAVATAAEWCFGVVALALGLSILAGWPGAQWLSLGYLLESSARVARSGRWRDGFIGVRRAARIGGAVVGAAVALLPLGLVRSYAASAALIDPGGPVSARWRAGLWLVGALTFVHLAATCARGGRLRQFLGPIGTARWLIRRLRRGGLYVESRDAFWAWVTALRLPHYFRVGLIGFLGTLAWLAPPAILISLGGRFVLLSVLGTLLLAVIVPFLPFLQVGYAVEGRARALFDVKAVRDRYRRAPWAFAFSLLVLLLAAIPLYLLKIEMIPREAAWLPSLVFVLFLAPARILTGWAYARSGRRDRPRHWLFRALGRLAIVPAAAFYVLVVFAAQYTSWGGTWSLYEQHAFLLPVPFLNM
jgi:hypothetical protein